MISEENNSHPSWETLQGIFLLISVGIVYYPTTQAGFIWDDDSFFTHNPIMVSPHALQRFWFSTDPPDYFPLVSTHLWMQRQVWGLHPLGYHLINIAFHALNAALLWRIFLRAAIPGAWVAAMMFALHPIQVESVSWATQIKTVQSTCFYLLSILWYLRSSANQDSRAYGLSLFLFSLALLSKTSVVMLPVILLLYHGWKRDRPLYPAIIRTFPYFLLSLIFGLITIWYQYNSAGAKGAGWSLSFLERCVIAGQNIMFYLYKLAVPLNLTFVYPRWEFDVSHWFSWTPHIGLGFILYIFYRQRDRSGRHSLMGLGYFIVSLFPVLGFFNIYFMLYSFVADHWQYIAGQGIIALTVAAATQGASKTTRSVQRIIRALTILILISFAGLTWKQQALYQNPVVLWKDTLNKNPKAWIAHNNLGNEMELLTDFEKAAWHYRQALRINPHYAEAEDNLGLILLKLGYAQESKVHFLKAIHLKSDFWEPHNNLGTVLANEGNYEDAKLHFEAVLKIDPFNSEAHNNLGVILEQRGHFEAALHHWEQALNHLSNRSQVYNNIGAMLLSLGKKNQAIRNFKEALKWNPQLREAQDNLNKAQRSLLN